MFFISKNRIINLFFASFLFLSSCGNIITKDEEEAIPFVLSKFELTKTDSKGNDQWKIKSPQASYDLKNRLVTLKDFVGYIYIQNIHTYSLHSSLGQIYNDGERISLEGNVRIIRIKGDPVSITGDSLEWLPNRSLLKIDKKPKAWNDYIQVSSKTVSFNHKKELVTFTGRTFLQNRNDLQTQLNNFKLSHNDGSWNLKTGLFNAKGPVKGYRLRRTDNLYQEIEGKSLFGNSKSYIIGLSKCMVIQKYEKIRSNKCTWNWLENSIQFSGNVSFIRDLNNQNIYNKLDLMISPDGTIKSKD